MSYNPIFNTIEAESVNQRLERMLSYFDHLPRYIERGKYTNYDPRNNIVAVKTSPEGNHYIKEWLFGANIVTDHGDAYYAKRGAVESPAANEGATRIQLANPASQNAVAKGNTWDNFDNPDGAAISGSNVTFASGYPKTNDSDTDNTGRGLKVTSYKGDWGTTTFNDGGVTIKNGAIHDNASPVAATKLITHFQITAFGKSASDTLKMYVNHAFAGS